LPDLTAPDGGADLRDPEPYEGRIATFNVENLFDCVDAPDKDDRTSCSPSVEEDLEAQVAKLALAFESELESPEIVIIEETENTEVLTGDADGEIPGSSVAALLPRLDGEWDAVSFDASDVRGIEVAFVYNTERVTLHDAFLSTDLLPDAGGVFNGTTFRAGREPLVGFFTLDDIDLTVIGNHFKSKGGPQATTPEAGDEPGDDPLYGSVQPPVRFTEQIRHQQADYVRDLVDLLLADGPESRIVVGGDLNDFAFPEPNEGLDTVTRIKESPTDPMSNVIDLIPEGTRYTFIFEGNSQVLDHILLNDEMAGLLTDQDIAHFNTDYPDAFGDEAGLPLRTSDHDPLVTFYCTDATAPEISLSVSPDELWPPNHKYRTVQATVSAEDDRDTDPAVELVSVISNEPDNAPGGGDGNTVNDIVIVDDDTFRLRAERDEGGDGRIYTISYRVTDACGNQTTASATVKVPLSR
jgi:predicted extracellular nuclease